MARAKASDDLASVEKKARFCEEKAAELLAAAGKSRLEETRVALLEVSEQWTTLASYYRSKASRLDEGQG